MLGDSRPVAQSPSTDGRGVTTLAWLVGWLSLRNRNFMVSLSLSVRAAASRSTAFSELMHAGSRKGGAWILGLAHGRMVDYNRRLCYFASTLVAFCKHASAHAPQYAHAKSDDATGQSSRPVTTERLLIKVSQAKPLPLPCSPSFRSLDRPISGERWLQFRLCIGFPTGSRVLFCQRCC